MIIQGRSELILRLAKGNGHNKIGASKRLGGPVQQINTKTVKIIFGLIFGLKHKTNTI